MDMCVCVCFNDGSKQKNLRTVDSQSYSVCNFTFVLLGVQQLRLFFCVSCFCYMRFIRLNLDLNAQKFTINMNIYVFIYFYFKNMLIKYEEHLIFNFYGVTALSCIYLYEIREI